MSDLNRHLRAYTMLAGILAVGLWGIVYFAFDRNVQTWIAVSMCVCYALWGIAHHAVEEKLQFRIVIEYLAMSLLGLVILVSLLYHA